MSRVPDDRPVLGWAFHPGASRLGEQKRVEQVNSNDAPKVQPDHPIKHHGRWRHRLDFPCHQTDRERALADAWEKGQQEGLLARLVTSVYDPKAKPLFPFDDKWIPHPENVSPRDAEVAATIIQWLGTNVGFSFIEEAFRACGYRIVYDHSRDEMRAGGAATPGGAE